MSDPRLPPERDRRQSRARFRCQPCSRFVTATDYGVCPGCGLGPPRAVDLEAERDPEAWNTARARARALGVGTGYWLLMALFAIALGVGAAILAVW